MNNKIHRDDLRLMLSEVTSGCEIQHDGWTCGTCFLAIKGMSLKEDMYKYWEAVLDFRGDYDDFDWGVETDTSKFPELIAELSEKLKKHLD